MEAVIYARLGLRELHKQLLEERVTTCREWGGQNKFQVVAVFTDWSCSGAHLDRGGFTELCEFVVKHPCPIVITELWQLTTNVRDAALIADVFDELGIQVYSVREGLICTSELAVLDKSLPTNQPSFVADVRRSDTPRSGIPRTSRQIINP